jgi:class 3 adenylate cyclase
MNKDEPIELDRTWLCVVVFVDMVKYSRQSQEVQAAWRERFREYVGEAIKGTSESQRVLLDCGDGAAIVFLGDPELPMLCALRVLSANVAENGRQPVPIKARIGINLGSVKLVRDINNNIAAAGDGINVGQRVMSFAGDNQILVSRSFFEVASLLSEKYAALFKYKGVRNDKHDRPHTLYELHLPDSIQPALANDSGADREDSPERTEHIAALESSLAQIVGPIAKHLVRNALQTNGSAADLRAALIALIPSEAGRDAFLHDCEPIIAALRPPVSQSPPAPPTSSKLPLEPAILERVRKDLASYIGPMAQVLVKRAAKRAATQFALYEMLAAEIPSATDREAFLKRSSKEVGH